MLHLFNVSFAFLNTTFSSELALNQVIESTEHFIQLELEFRGRDVQLIFDIDDYTDLQINLHEHFSQFYPSKFIDEYILYEKPQNMEDFCKINIILVPRITAIRFLNYVSIQINFLDLY